MERPAIFMTYFQSSSQVWHLHKVLLFANVWKENDGPGNISRNYQSFSQIWTTFARNVMKRPLFFMMYFQRLYQFVQVHKTLLSAFFEKRIATFRNFKKSILNFANLNNCFKKIYEKSSRFYNTFLKFISSCPLTQSLTTFKSLKRKWQF